MKKVITTLVFSLLTLSMFAQSIASAAPQRLKYVTNAPDGSVAMTVYDDSREDSIKLEAADSFYRYQILNPKTNEAIYTASNSGKSCEIKKSKVAPGTYPIRLYTRSFVITSRITISAGRTINRVVNDDAVAMND